MYILRRKSLSGGFTLLELLVVISIIGILIAISAAAFTTAQQKARNAKRQGDIQAMSKAFEQYYATTNGTYNVTNNCINMASSLPGGALPRDPKTGNLYSCALRGGVANTYCVCAELEPMNNTNGNASTSTCTGLGNPGRFYCVVNQQ